MRKSRLTAPSRRDAEFGFDSSRAFAGDHPRVDSFSCQQSLLRGLTGFR
jgi:hypothetical protein